MMVFCQTERSRRLTRSRCLILGSITYLFLSCGSEPETRFTGTPIFGHYLHEDSLIIGYSELTLYPDSTYNYWSGMCVGSVMDSGNFSMHADTLDFKSVLGDRVDSTNHGFDQIRPLTGEKYLVKEKEIFYGLENGKYDASAVLTKIDSAN